MRISRHDLRRRYSNSLVIDAGSQFSLRACSQANVYTVYVHLNEANGEVVHSNCTCTAGKGGQCKHVVALLFQVIEYKQLDMTEIPDKPTCTQLLQQ